jgi:hypothetical protein
LIDANALLDYLRYEGHESEVIEAVKDAPTVDAVEVVHGRWIETEEGTICSECNEHPFEDGEYAIANYKANYCPNCGARMDGGVENGC